MAKQSRRRFLAQASAALAAAQAFSKPLPNLEASEWVLWYKQPAKIWTDALPVGNGCLGAMVFGGVDEERLQLNEDTLWSGAPHEWNNPQASDALPDIRKAVLEDKNYKEADRLCHKMQGPYNESFQPLGNLRMKFSGLGEASEYRRELDLDSGVTQVSFEAGGVSYRRSVFCSAPDQVIVLRLSASKKGALTLTIRLDSLLQAKSEVLGAKGLRLRGKAPAHVEPNYVNSPNPVIYDASDGKGMRFECRLEVRHNGGKVASAGEDLQISGANEVTILLTAATGYRGFDQMPDKSADEIGGVCERRLLAVGQQKRRRIIAPSSGGPSITVSPHESRYRKVGSVNHADRCAIEGIRY